MRSPRCLFPSSLVLLIFDIEFQRTSTLMRIHAVWLICLGCFLTANINRVIPAIHCSAVIVENTIYQKFFIVMKCCLNSFHLWTLLQIYSNEQGKLKDYSSFTPAYETMNSYLSVGQVRVLVSVRHKTCTSASFKNCRTSGKRSRTELIFHVANFIKNTLGLT